MIGKLVDGIKEDLGFIRSHTLQPQWYKVFKVFMLAGFFIGYWYFFGMQKTFAFFIVFMLLSLVVHMVYRIQTETWQRSWLDFKVVEGDGEVRTERIGKFYYSAVILNALIALVISLVVF